MSRMKFEGRGSEGKFAAASLYLDEDEFVASIISVFYMGRVDSRLVALNMLTQAIS